MGRPALLQITRRVYTRWQLNQTYHYALNQKVSQIVQQIYQNSSEWQDKIELFHDLLSKTNIYNMRPNPTGSMVKASVRAGRIPVFYLSLPPFESYGGKESFRTIEGLMEQVASPLIHNTQAIRFSSLKDKVIALFTPDEERYIDDRVLRWVFINAAIARSIPLIWEVNKAKFDRARAKLPRIQDDHIAKLATSKFHSMAIYALKHGASADRLREILNQCIVKVTMEQ
jgi:hypothetical protein